MNIRRFVAADMRKVLRAVRAELGPDAVILSTQNIDDGVEVIAAIDYDDTLLPRWAARRPGIDEVVDDEPTPDPGPVEPNDAVGSADGPAVRPRQSPATAYARVADGALASGAARSPAPTPSARPETVRPRTVRPEPRRPSKHAQPGAREGAARGAVAADVAAELSDLRELLEHQLSSLAWNDLNRRHPVRARTLRQFAKLGLDPRVAERLAARGGTGRSRGGAWRLPLQLLAERLPLAKHDLVDYSGVYAVIGPTGVGKTTTIAKIAARFALRHGIDGLGLVTTDGYRVGARDQLLTFARILGTPMHVVNNAGEMRSTLEGLRQKRLVLVDTAGMSQRDARLGGQFGVLRAGGKRIRTVLALSAASDLGCLRETLRVFRAAHPIGLIATKLDEAVSLGPLLSLVLEAGLPLAYLCDGQRVPEDLHLASHRRAWIIRTAVERARETPRQDGEAELATAFGAMGRVANG